MSSNFHGILR